MDADYRRRVIQSCFPTFSVRTVVFLAEGYSSTVWEVNGEYVFRFPKRPEIAPGLLKEIRILPVLAGALPLRVPRFEYVWQGGAQYEGLFVGYAKIPGVPLAREHLASPCVERVSRQLGQFLTALHLFPRQRAGALGIPDSGAQGWRQHYDAFYQKVRHRIFPLLDVNEQRDLAATWEGFLENEANFRFKPVWVHADLTGEHILFDAQQGCITGILDWEDATVGDPALDFTGLLGDYGRDFTLHVLAAYHGPADAEILTRARFYDAIGPCYELLFGLDFGLATHITSALASLRTAQVLQGS
jgi:aminoglycoside 2''-phosphotransferase